MLEGAGRDDRPLPSWCRLAGRGERALIAVSRWWSRSWKRWRGVPVTVIVKMEWRLGDEVMALPVLAALRRDHPLDRIIARLRRLGIPAHMSRDAGGSLCNAVLYHSLHAVRGSLRPACNGFVHIPDALVRLPRRQRMAWPCPLDWEQALAGALEIVATCVGQPAPT